MRTSKPLDLPTAAAKARVEILNLKKKNKNPSDDVYNVKMKCCGTICTMTLRVMRQRAAQNAVGCRHCRHSSRVLDFEYGYIPQPNWSVPKCLEDVEFIPR